jgi:hypothetical protein
MLRTTLKNPFASKSLYKTFGKSFINNLLEKALPTTFLWKRKLD